MVTQMQTAWTLWIRDLAETLETHLAEVKHKRELKLWHPELLACVRLLQPWYTERIGGLPPPRCCHPSSGLQATSSKPVWETFSGSNRIFSCWSHTWLKKKNKKKKQNSKTLNCQPVKGFSMPHYTEKTRGLQHCQILAPNLPRRCRQTGLDVKGVTPELLRLKFYWSQTGNFLFLLSLSVCLSCSLFDCPPSLPVDFFGSPFFFLFFFLFLPWFC
jgi:hypothetical protein